MNDDLKLFEDSPHSMKLFVRTVCKLSRCIDKLESPHSSWEVLHFLSKASAQKEFFLLSAVGDQAPIKNFLMLEHTSILFVIFPNCRGHQYVIDVLSIFY